MTTQPRSTVASLVGLALVLACAHGAVQAQGIRQDRPGAFLLFPSVVNESGDGTAVETFVSMTNTSDSTVLARAAFFDGTSCAPCELDVGLGPRETATVVAIRQGATRSGNITELRNLSTGTSELCPGADGFVTVHLENGSGSTIYDDALIGSAVVADYGAGRSYSTQAIAIQSGNDAGDGDRSFSFDGTELRRLPRTLRAAFLTPTRELKPISSRFDGVLTLVAPGQEANAPYQCDLTLRGASGASITRSLQFQCWEQVSFEDIDPALTFPAFQDESGWIELSCGSDIDGDGTRDIQGGVHGSLTQIAEAGTILRRSQLGPLIGSPTGWSRLLGQSRSTGDAVMLDLGGDDNCPGIPNPEQTDTDDDGAGDACDVDDDNDGVTDSLDPSPLDPDVCGDLDADTCDDCSLGLDDFGPLTDSLPDADGPDLDGDGVCDPADADLDGDGVTNESDTDPLDPERCSDVDADTCDDCSGGTFRPAFDGLDSDSDGICNEGDNCVIDANPDQADADDDGIGDACELASGSTAGAGNRRRPDVQPDRSRED